MGGGRCYLLPMGTLQREGDGPPHPLGGECLVGRSRRSDLRLEAPEVSSNHAQIRWTSQGWEVTDLGSRNGTFLDGQRLTSGERVALRKGSALSFGAQAPRWLMSSDSAPAAAATSLRDGRRIGAEGGLIALSDTPPVSVYQDSEGAWVIDSGGELAPAEDLQVVELGGEAWRLALPDATAHTLEARLPSVSLLRLEFGVSRNEEYVTLRAQWAGGVVELGEKAHNYLLLTLARIRLRDRDAGDSSPGEEGWVDVDTLLSMLRVEESRLNVDIYRARKEAGHVGIEDAANLVERRRYKRQLRLGPDRITIEQL